MPPEMYTLRDVAEKLKLPYEVGRDAVYAGRWPHTKFTPRNRRMSQADIDAVIDAHHQEPEPTVLLAAHQRRRRMAELLKAV